MRPLYALVVLIIAFSADLASGQSTEPAESGTIRGGLVTHDSQRAMPGRAAVFLCDAETGLPMMPDTRKPLDISQRTDKQFSFDAFWHVETDNHGSFEFQDVPVGEYRLVAQAWAGISGVPRGLPPSRDDPRPEPSAIIVLHGVVEDVKVKAGEETIAYVKQLGTEVQHILCDPAEGHNYVLIGLNPTLGDHVLSIVGWDKHYLTGVVGLTRMEVPHLTIIGLPDEMEVHVSLFNYDNNAGVGGVSFIAGEQPTVRLPIYASWSNGKYEPPARLARLTAHLEQSGAKIEDLLPLERSWGRSYFDYVWHHGHDEIELEGFGPVKVVDLLAAGSYRSLRKSHARRLERLQRQQPADAAR